MIFIQLHTHPGLQIIIDMENEATNNEILQAINNLNDNTVGVNNSVKELQEYFILKEKGNSKKKKH